MDKSGITLGLIILFLIAWVYTEVSEHLNRDKFKAEVIDFMDRGNRFTQEDGDALIRRLDDLEESHGD